MSTCCILGLRHEWSTNQLGGGVVSVLIAC
jgi:hypothetical protein